MQQSSQSSRSHSTPPRPVGEAPQTDSRIGNVIDGRYWIRKCIGSGAMGLVYLAVRERIGRPVAVKFLRASAASDPQFLRRFEVEARALGRLQHPHCASVIDFGVADAPYIVMQYVSGPTLRDALADGPLSIERSLAITRQLLAGLAHAHRCGVIHRDIKPSNVKLEEVTGSDSYVRLLDFGLAKLIGAQTNMPPSNPFITVGTPSYMSPEQFCGNKIDARSDVYSAGAMLFELLTGRKPFVFDEPRDGFEMHRAWPRPRLRQVDPDGGFSAELERVVLRAMAKSPADRYQSALEFSAAIDALTDGIPVASDHRFDLTARVHARTHIGQRAMAVVAAAVAASAIALVVAHQVSDRPEAHGSAAVAAVDIAPLPTADADYSEDAQNARELVLRADALFENSRWSRALPLYRQAIQLDPAMRLRARIHENAVRALSGKRSHGKAALLIERELGVLAIPYLERAKQISDNPRVRRRASRLLAKVRAQRP